MTEIGIADLVKIMIEDRNVREAQWEAEQRREREVADLERAQMLERALADVQTNGDSDTGGDKSYKG